MAAQQLHAQNNTAKHNKARERLQDDGSRTGAIPHYAYTVLL
jgi:hypothetical protein